jgi:hypothetical protein
MRKTILSLLVLLAFTLGASAQTITLKVDNNTSQYFTATLLDNTWMGVTPANVYGSAQQYDLCTLRPSGQWRRIDFRSQLARHSAQGLPFRNLLPGSLFYDSTFCFAPHSLWPRHSC